MPGFCRLHRGGRLDAVPATAARRRLMAKRLAEGTLAPASWQCRRAAPRVGRRQRHYRQPAHGGAGGEAVSAVAGGGSTGDGAVRDAAGQANADRLWRRPGRDRRAKQRVSVCCHPWLLAPLSHQGVPQRAGNMHQRFRIAGACCQENRGVEGTTSPLRRK
jgi:hypothetical protein